MDRLILAHEVEGSRAHPAVPIAAGEQFGVKLDFSQLIEEEWIDYLRPPTAPGLGIELDREAAKSLMRRYRAWAYS